MGKQAVTRLCIIIPAYNEAGAIASVLQGVPRSRKFHKVNFQVDILVVDDGSSDKTSEITRSVADVKIVRHIINLGAGAATRTGLHYARDHNYDMAISMDADGQHAASDVLGLALKMVQEPSVDLLIGSRLQGSGNMPAYKRLGNIGLSYITYVLLGTYVSDSQSGLRAYSRKCLEELSFYSNRYAFCSEMIWQAKRAGLKIAEYPIEAIYTEYSMRKGQKNVSGAMKILQQLILRRFMDMLQ